MFITKIFYNIKKLYEWLTYPSKRYAEEFSKKWSKYYVDEYISSQVLKSTPSLSSEKYSGSNPPSPKYTYNKY